MSDASAPPVPTLLSRLASRPMPIFLGVIVGFLGCCVAGRIAARQPVPNFVRYHQGISPESHFYPTHSTTLELARRHVKPGKVMVIVGGNSVLYGFGQRAEHVWSARLQELLGDDFVVLNLALPGAYANEFASLIAERLTADGVPVVYVTVGIEPANWACDWDGHQYRYFFWDGWGKGLVPPDPRRDRWLADGIQSRYGNNPKEREKMSELRHRGTVDSLTDSHDLWTAFAYHYRASVWTPVKGSRFWWPHNRIPDFDEGGTVPFEKYHNSSHVPRESAYLRGLFQSDIGQKLLRGEGYELVGAQYKAYLPDALRDRTLYVLRVDGLYFRKQLAPAEQATLVAFYHHFRDAISQAGLNVQLVGEDYIEHDYHDRAHFSEQGGRKLAADLAPSVRAMAAKFYGTNRAKGNQP